MITDLTRRFPVDDVELAWDRWGAASGTPLLLCHGFSGCSNDFALHVEALAERRPVVAVDHRGHGLSTKLGRLDGYSLERLVADLTAFVDGALGGPVDLLGHSMGGAICLRLTLDRPDLVRSLILMDTSAWSFRPVDRDVAALYDAFFDGFDPASGLPDLTALAGPEDALIQAATPAEWQAIAAERSAAFDPYAMRALGHDLIVASAGAVRDRLGEVTCPVTVIVGEHDEPFAGQAPALAAEVAHGELIVIDGAYHSPQLTHGDAWRRAVETHLARI